MRPSLTAIVLSFIYIGLVLWITLGPVPWAGAGYQAPDGVLEWRIWFDENTWTQGSEFELGLNVLLFVPLGGLLVIAMRGLPLAVPIAVALGLTVFIEVAQIPLADRISDPRDLAANGFGALVGAVIARVFDLAFRRAVKPTARPARPGRPARPASSRTRRVPRVDSA